MHFTILPRLLKITVVAAVLFVLPNVGCIFAQDGGAETAKPLADLQREVDELLAKGDSVEARHNAGLIFQLAERLRKEKGDAEARRYFEAGLAANSWALEHQLTLGEILARAGQSEVLREKAGMVLRLGEEDAVLSRALVLLSQKLPPPPPPLEGIEADGATLALVPVGGTNAVVLEDFREALHRCLGIKVCVARCAVMLPPATRTMHQRWVAQTRPRLVATAKEKPALAALLGSWGFTMKQIESDDAALVQAVRRITAEEQGPAAAREFDAMLKGLEDAVQWDAGGILKSVEAAARGVAKPDVMVLAVTSLDLCGDNANFVFGVAQTGRPFGIISLHRFQASFTGEPPQRSRLIERVSKQALSTFGFMLGVPRCTTPECARAYPQSLAEHDQKPSTPCPQCRAGMELALGRKLPVGK